MLVVHGDKQLLAAVRKEKEKPGKDLGVPGGIRTAQTLARLGLVDEYVLTVHPVTLGRGKRLFTGRTSLELTGAKTYRSGAIRATYRPAPGPCGHCCGRHHSVVAVDVAASSPAQRAGGTAESLLEPASCRERRVFWGTGLRCWSRLLDFRCRLNERCRVFPQVLPLVPACSQGD